MQSRIPPTCPRLTSSPASRAASSNVQIGLVVGAMIEACEAGASPRAKKKNR